MRAHAQVVAEPDGHGGTRLARLRGDPPLLLRQAAPDRGFATLYLRGGAAGPLGGDDLLLEIVVRPDAALRISSVAASIALPGHDGAESRVTVRASIAAGGSLQWLPEQLIAAGGCRHRSVSTVDLAVGASLLWRDELVCGRHDELPGDTTMTTSITYAGRPLLRQAVRVGPSADSWAGPGVLAGAKATGCLIAVSPDPMSQDSMPQDPLVRDPVVLGPDAVRVPLRCPDMGSAGATGWLVTATAPDAGRLRRSLTPRG